MRACNIAQRRAAEDVRAVGEVLHGYACAAAQLRKHRAGDRVGRVLLVGVVLDDDAAVEGCAVIRVVLLRVIGVDGVRVVRGEHEAGGNRGADGRLAHPQRAGRAVQRVGEEGGVRALLGAAADLLVVEHRHHADMADGRGGGEQRLKRGIRAFEVIDARAGEELALRAPHAAALPVVEEQIARDHVLGLHAAQAGDFCAERALGLLVPKERQHVHLRVELVAVVDLAVEVDGHVRDERRVAVKVDELRAQAVALAYERAPGDGQRPVQPCGHNHAAIALDVQPRVLAADQLLGIRLELEGRAVAVACDNLEVCKALLRHGEGDDGGEVARDEVAAAGHDGVGLALVQTDKARALERAAQRIRRVERAG